MELSNPTIVIILISQLHERFQLCGAIPPGTLSQNHRGYKVERWEGPSLWLSISRETLNATIPSTVRYGHDRIGMVGLLRAMAAPVLSQPHAVRQRTAIINPWENLVSEKSRACENGFKDYASPEMTRCNSFERGSRIPPQ